MNEGPKRPEAEKAVGWALERHDIYSIDANMGPKEGPKYGKDGSARGRDPLGAHDKKKGGSGSPKYGMALAHFDALKKSLGGGVSSEDKKILSETLDVEKEYEEEVLKEDNGGMDE